MNTYLYLLNLTMVDAVEGWVLISLKISKKMLSYSSLVRQLAEATKSAKIKNFFMFGKTFL